MKKLVAITIILILSFFAVTLIFSSYHNMQTRKIKDLSQSVFPEMRIEILDATGETGDSVLQYITEFLKKLNFDITYAGKAIDTIGFTYVVDRVDSNMQNAKHIARILGVSRTHFSQDMDSTEDVTIILGKDYEKIINKLEDDYGFKR